MQAPSEEATKILSRHFESLLQHRSSYHALMDVGDLYLRGFYPFYQRDPEAALQIYRALAARGFTEVNTSLINATNLHTEAHDQVGAPMDRKYLWTALQAINALPQAAPNRFRAPPVDLPVERETPEEAQDRRRRLQTHLAYDNPQNVHDFSVEDATRRTINLIIKRWENNTSCCLPYTVTKYLILRALQKECAPEDRTHLSRARSYIMYSMPSTTHGLFHVSPLKLLCGVWWYIHNTVQFTNVQQKNLRERVCYALSDCLEHGLVCLTGQLTRIASVFDTVDDSLAPKVPFKALRDELFQLAGDIREQYLATQSNEEVDMYNSNQDDGVHGKIMKERFCKSVTETYVKQLAFSQDLITKAIDDIVTTF